MTPRPGLRFLLETVFLLVIAGVAAFADIDALAIVGLVAAGWVIVAAFEWAAWRDRPHYGAGLPPRYYVPRIDLPPAQPLELLPTGYPEAVRDEAPTWIASAALRQEMLGEWPLSPPAEEPAPEPEPEPAPVLVSEDTQPEPPPVDDSPDDPWLVVELPAAPLGEPEPEPELEPVAAVVVEAAPEPVLDAILFETVERRARYSVDPLAEPAPRRRFRRGGKDAPPSVEVAERPTGVRPLPGRAADDSRRA